MNFNGTNYYYLVNLQGDVMGIVDSTGNIVVSYTYDAWGKPLSTTGMMASTLGSLNPLRYRGYVYDQETGLYYLQSRYYNPEIGRFINADDYISTGQGLLSKNAFTYCYNNPVIYSDYAGEFPWLIVGIVVSCIVTIGVDHWLAANQPEGGYAIVNKPYGDGVRMKAVYAEGNGFEVDANGMTVCDIEVGLLSASWESDYLDVEAIDCLTASATAEVDWSGTPSVDVSASASVYSPHADIVFPLGAYNVTLSFEALVCAAAVGIELDSDTGKFKITPPTLGTGWSFGVDIDLIG
ncbi:MAG: RHS repeat-associated core domain-containing protein [Ruminococcaceae bacterium]|nr:RHS repeat-associated core domain-containing protein [Oscillospiraceae bacterium]